ncbi:hypothetical protein AB0C69_41290, partial [Actinomadura sp. NPDC048032]|uniref:hypothetical protein n=1 Tax=Actinomadura sp. NPDC048032 TaxID=3155747 RepID=UPI00340AF1D9
QHGPTVASLPHDGPVRSAPAQRRAPAAGRPVRPEFVVDLRAALGPGLVISEVDAGHMLYVDRPEETGTLVAAWLSAGGADR